MSRVTVSEHKQSIEFLVTSWEKAAFGYKYGKGFGKRSTFPQPIFLRVPLPGKKEMRGR